MSDVSFTDAVAERSGHPASEVADVLRAAHVPTSDVQSEPHRLRVTRLQFRGQKEGKVTDEIDFDREFGDGLWSISSEKNQRGKSSIMEIMMWAIRGQPKRLMPEVRKWLHFVALEGTVDGEDFRVEFDLTSGMPVGSASSVAYLRRRGPSVRVRRRVRRGDVAVHDGPPWVQQVHPVGFREG